MTYKEAPSQEIAPQQLSMQLDALFATTTGYTVLDERMAMTSDKQKFLLLHNHGSE